MQYKIKFGTNKIPMTITISKDGRMFCMSETVKLPTKTKSKGKSK